MNIMKRKCWFLFGLLVMVKLIVTAQGSCCSRPATESFAAFLKDDKFVSDHESPIPFELMDQKGKMISFKTPDGVDGNAYEIKAAKTSNKYVFVIHEWWGLNDYIKQESEKIYTTLGDVNVIALDLYDKKVADNKEDAAKYMGGVKTERAQSIINGAIAYTGKNASIAIIGWCFGGGWSLQGSILAGKQGKACVMYYGMPEKDKEKLKGLKADVLGIFAKKDGWISTEIVDNFEKEMKGLKKGITIKQYDADHAFANPSNPHFNKEYSEEAFGIAMKFIKERLK
jgi:carboxymethylenebutenolidase